MDGWFFLGIVLTFPGTFSFSSVSATSSFADDIAHTKIRWSETYGLFPQPRGRSVYVPFLFYGVID